MSLFHKLFAEGLGAFWLTLAGCGSAVMAATIPEGGIGIVGVSLAFGLAALTMAYAVGPVSGAHLNPAVTLGLAVAGRFSWRYVLPYMLVQVVGATIGAWLLSMIASGLPGFDIERSTLAANGYAEHSPYGYSLLACFACEVVTTFAFVGIVLAATRRPDGLQTAPIVIGVALTLVHLVSMPVTNTSVNPARSTAPALMVQGWALSQLWLFWVAPLLGAVLAGRMTAWLCGGAPDSHAAPVNAAPDT
ncbi:aquaporin Z [Cupriavidus necator]|uniref:aquaporin Z n=1 Tax=Cupriavidus necator TaxID=106590 RepID=UPI00339D6CCB